MMFTITISVSSIYSTNIVVIVPIIWLYITVVVVVISFSIMVSCLFISLLLVTIGITYSRIGRVVNMVIILFDGENISFDASLVMYMNSTSIPPIIIINRIYENQNLLYMVPLIRHTIIVCINSISPMAIGCFICVNISLVIVLIDMNSFVISGGILF